ncbi:MAG: alpha/beta fold hydrolase [Chloroflexota bacterium]
MNIHDLYVSEGAKPKFRRGGTEAGCLLIHGFSAAPAEITWLGDHLHETLNLTTYAPRLTGHGTDPQHMRRMHWPDWYASVCDGYELLAAQCEKVFVAGISMGGLLALLLMACEESQIEAGAVIAAPIYYKHNRVAATRYLKYLQRMKSMPDKSTMPDLLREEQERRGEPVIGRTHYNVWSLQAVAQLYDLTLIVRDHLPQIATPMTLLYAENDHSVALESIEAIKTQTRAERIETHILEQSGHIITQDIEREKAFTVTEQFFSQFLIGEGAR